ncbi:hypothetical protein PDL67_11015 [Bacillus cereus]|nr:hypothetical protein [Bacillus cereus]
MKKPYNHLLVEQKENIIELYYRNASLEDIEDLAGASKRAVRRVLKEAGIDTRRKNRYTLDEHYFDEIDTEQKAYWLGFIYADGFVGDDKFNNIVIALSEVDLPHIESFADSINYRVAEGIERIRNSGPGGFENSKDIYVLNFSCSHMANALRNHGLYPGKSMTMAEFPNINPSLIRHFIRGYFDGDGSCYPVKPSSYHKGVKYEYDAVEFSIVGTKPFLEIMKSYLPIPTGNELKKSKTEEMKYLRMTAYGTNIMDIYKYLYEDATVFLKRKLDKLINSPCMQQCLQQTPNMLETPKANSTVA